MKKSKRNNVVAVLLITQIIIPAGMHNDTEYFSGDLKDKPLSVCKSVPQMKINLRYLLNGHLTWFRSLMLCVACELPGRTLTKKHLLQDLNAIGNAAKVYYGKTNGEKINAFLSAHTDLSILIIEAAKKGNLKELDEAEMRSDKNAGDLAELLCGLNPNWKLPEMKTMIKEYFSIAINECMYGLNKKRETDLVGFKKIQEEIVKVGYFISLGIFKQFPEKFGQDILK